MAQQPVKDSDPTIGRLVSDASRDLSSLVRSEIRLAKSEIQVSIKTGARNKGQLIINFNDLDALDGVIARLRGESVES